MRSRSTPNTLTSYTQVSNILHHNTCQLLHISSSRLLLHDRDTRQMNNNTDTSQLLHNRDTRQLLFLNPVTSQQLIYSPHTMHCQQFLILGKQFNLGMKNTSMNG